MNRPLVPDAPHLADCLTGQRCYLLGHGPSIQDIPLDGLDGPTMVMSLPPDGFHPDFLVAIDDLGDVRAQWDAAPDTTVRLFPTVLLKQERFPADGRHFVFRDVLDGASPQEFLTRDRVDWGDYPQLGNCGVRSTMLACLKLLYWMGCRDVVLCGVDFYEDGRGERFFELLQAKLHCLKPAFDDAGFIVTNANPNSNLAVFPTVKPPCPALLTESRAVGV